MPPAHHHDRFGGRGRAHARAKYEGRVRDRYGSADVLNSETSDLFPWATTRSSCACALPITDDGRRHDLVLDIGGTAAVDAAPRLLAHEGTLVIVGGEGETASQAASTANSGQ